MARYAIISDIHGNLHAFDAVLRHMGTLEVDEAVCLGDVVGYGPQPGECLDLVIRYCSYVVRGNHDEAAVDPYCAATFNGAAREAIYWTRSHLGALHLNSLNELPYRVRFGPDERIFCVHASPYDGPTDYVHDKRVAALAFRGVDRQICMVGHTHMPMVYEAPDGQIDRELTAPEITAYIPSHELPIALHPDRRYILNPGSVGQPRDCDPRASYAVLDTDAWTFTVHRVDYDIAAAQAATQAAGLPTILADRLAVGA
jgi:predicted phosphodiesterase